MTTFYFFFLLTEFTYLKSMQDCHQISLLILREFERINFYSPLRSSENHISFLMISGGKSWFSKLWLIADEKLDEDPQENTCSQSTIHQNQLYKTLELSLNFVLMSSSLTLNWYLPVTKLPGNYKDKCHFSL